MLDAWGGTEVVPVYPSDIEIEQGREHLRCYQLNENGLFRWAAACCRSPVFNTQPGFPWAGIPAKAYTNVRADALDGLGDVRCRIYGRDAKGEAPFPISSKIAFRDMMVVLPFIIKGKLLGKHRHSPFFESDGKTPTVTPEILGSR
ncbi:MAG: hypothetical protein CSB44_09345 [Gammaproteobacteria bacterium]|nr:MAG: hypothetical protein CSB44_09345 [Gammaproteobacteria bacterium]